MKPALRRLAAILGQLPALWAAALMSAAGFGRLICYEQLLPWPLLRWAVEKATILIAVSNEAWTGNP